MPAGTRDITIEQGANFEMNVTWMVGSATPVPKDLTGASGWMQIRQQSGSTVLLDLSSTDNEIYFPGNGVISVQIDHTQTASLTVKRAKYDLFVGLSDGSYVKLLKGKVTIDPRITVVI